MLKLAHDYHATGDYKKSLYHSRHVEDLFNNPLKFVNIARAKINDKKYKDWLKNNPLKDLK